MNVAAWIDRHARVNPGAPATVGSDGVPVSWEATADQIARVAAGLAARGVGTGDRVALVLRNSTAFFQSYFGILRNGACVVPLNIRWTAQELQFALVDSGARFVIASAEFADALASVTADVPVAWVLDGVDRDAPGPLTLDVLAEETPIRRAVQRAGDDLGEIMYTAGTTGRPKGVQHTHRLLEAAAMSKIDFFEFGADDVGLSVSPLFHVGGLTVMLVGAVGGFPTAFLRRWDVEEFLRLVQEHRVTYAHLVTTLLVDVARAGAPMVSAYDTSSLRVTYGGGGIATPDQYAFYEKHVGGLFSGGYGRTEASGVAWNPADRASRKEIPPGALSIGAALRSVGDVRIVAPAGDECGVGEIGEILLRGDGVARAYWNAPELTSDTFDADGWMHTGDRGWLDKDGFLAFVGRADGMIKTGGENVYVADVETTLLTMPGISEAAVVGIPDVRLGTMVAACVACVAGSPLTATDIDAWCRASMASFKRPRAIVVVDRLPKLGSHKTDYAAAAALVAARQSLQ